MSAKLKSGISIGILFVASYPVKFKWTRIEFMIVSRYSLAVKFKFSSVVLLGF